MPEVDWYKCKFLESTENLKPLVKKRFGREPSSSLAREIVACLQQGRLFYEAAASSPLEIRPLQQFYGMIGFAKALIVASQQHSLSTLKRSHGLLDIAQGNCRIADMRLKILAAGTFQEFNRVVAPLNRVAYFNHEARRREIYLPSAGSETLDELEMSLKDILSRIPGLESLYAMTFGEEANTASVLLEPSLYEDRSFRIRITDTRVFDNRESIKEIVTKWRGKFPFLNGWRLNSAQPTWDCSYFYFRNVRNEGIDEFSEEYLAFQNGSFLETAVPEDKNELFILEDGLDPVGGGFGSGRVNAISPIGDLCLSEFSLHYLGLFLLSSLIRYRPEMWTRAISRSVIAGEPADDKALSLIERFLDLNARMMPEFVVRVSNPYEDSSLG